MLYETFLVKKFQMNHKFVKFGTREYTLKSMTLFLLEIFISLKEFVKARPEFKNLEEAASKKNPNRDRNKSPSIDNSTKGVPETTLSCLKVIAKVT